MNYLAHLYLSGNDPEILIGNFIADHVKGSAINNFSEGVQKGIQIHRAIDSFTDSHPVVMESKIRLRPLFRKYAPVIADVYYDHFLARDWDQYHHQSLETFSLETYRFLNEQEIMFPERTKMMLRYMSTHNWLLSYAKIEGINKALTGMSRRTPFENTMQHGAAFLEENYTAFESEFETYFPELRNFVAALLL